MSHWELIQRANSGWNIVLSFLLSGWWIHLHGYPSYWFVALDWCTGINIFFLYRAMLQGSLQLSSGSWCRVGLIRDIRRALTKLSEKQQEVEVEVRRRWGLYNQAVTLLHWASVHRLKKKRPISRFLLISKHTRSNSWDITPYYRIIIRVHTWWSSREKRRKKKQTDTNAIPSYRERQRIHNSCSSGRPLDNFHGTHDQDKSRREDPGRC